jgi:hypothetical protein
MESMKITKRIFTGILALLLCFSFMPPAVMAQDTVTAEQVIKTTLTAEEGITPKLIVVPGLDLFATIEPVGQTAGGAMDVPTDWRDIAWYEPGYAPGENGHAALAGHLDWEGNKGPFWGLADLKDGELINASQQVFGASSESRISLITCEGDFVAAEDTYDQRRVVEAKLIFDTAAPGQLSQI